MYVKGTCISIILQMNPVLAISESLLSEEAQSGNTVGEEEEGVVSDPGTEILSETDSKVKVLMFYIYIY